MGDVGPSPLHQMRPNIEVTSEKWDVGGSAVAGDPSFDVVSKVDRQEVDNAVNQTAKEVLQRFDFKGTDAEITWANDVVVIVANSDKRALAVLDVLQTKLVKRGVSLKALKSGDPKPSGKLYRIESTLVDGLDQENAKKIAKLIREEGPKGVKTQVTGDELRVSGKSRDDLQAVIALVKGAELEIAVQFVNYR